MLRKNPAEGGRRSGSEGCDERTDARPRASFSVSCARPDADLKHSGDAEEKPGRGRPSVRDLFYLNLLSESSVLLQHALLGDGDVVAGGVLDHVHHLVGLAD